MKSILFSTLLVISNATLSAQTITRKTNAFDSVNDERTSHNDGERAKRKDLNCIKFNLYDVGRGVFALSYERLLTDFLGLELSAGATYRDFIFEYIKKTGTSENATVNMGYALAAGLRIYPGKNMNFDGAYISPEFSFRQYNITDNKSSTTQPNNTLNAGYSMFDIRIKFGVLNESILIDDAVVDFYMGFGFRAVTLYKINEKGEMNPLTGNYDIYSSNKTNLFIPQFILGAKIGLPF